MAVAISDVIPSVKDYSRNQSLANDRAIRAINSASNFVFSHLGIPSQELEFSFQYDQDENFIALPSDFDDFISLRYKDDTLNKGSLFSYRRGEMLYPRIKTIGGDTKLFGPYNAAGTRQMIVLALNSIAPLVIDTFDSSNSTNWTASDDTVNIRDDDNVKQEGAGSLAFDITTNTAHRASLTKVSANYDLTTMQDVAHFKFWVYLPSITNFTSISFNWGSDSSNYYKRTVTAQEDGTAFVVGWNKIDCPWDSSKSTVGTPVISTITFIKINLDYAAGFTAPTVNFRLDFLRAIVPDSMILTYYTRTKGHTSGGTAIEDFTATTDTFSFGTWDTSIKELIAIWAAVILNPQILVDDEYVRKVYSEFYSLYSRKYPRKRVANLLADPVVAKTTNDISQ